MRIRRSLDVAIHVVSLQLIYTSIVVFGGALRHKTSW